MEPVTQNVEKMDLNDNAAAVRNGFDNNSDLIDRNESLFGREFTVGWVVDSLRKNDHEFKKLHGKRQVKKVDQEDISEGKGFLSIVVRCTLHFTDSTSENDVYTTIIKIPGMESVDKILKTSKDEFTMENKFAAKVVRFHKFECEFYESLAPKFQFPVPKVYQTALWVYGKKDGCIHMEDLSKTSRSLTFYDTVTMSHIREVTRHLARMHKQLLCSEDSSWKTIFADTKKTFTEGTTQLSKFVEPFMKMLTKEQEEMARRLYKKYEKLSENQDFTVYANCEAHKELGLASVIVHGDLSGGNLMWKLNKHGDITSKLAAFVDFQIIHEGSPMSDLCRFISVSADANVRREAELCIFDYYHDILTAEMASEGRQNPYTVENLKKSYDICQMKNTFISWMISVFVKDTLPIGDEFKTLNKAKLDKSVLKVLYLFEDLDRKMVGEYSYLFDKYGK